MTAPFEYPLFPVFDDDALCAEVDPDLMFPEPGGDYGYTAKALCGRCEIQSQCLEWALTNNERHGIWGGTTERERNAIREGRRMRGLAPIPHGTEAGYAAHRRRNEPVPLSDPCGCRAGARLAKQQRKTRNAA